MISLIRMKHPVSLEVSRSTLGFYCIFYIWEHKWGSIWISPAKCTFRSQPYTRRCSGVGTHLRHPLTRSLHPDLKTKLCGVRADRWRNDRSWTLRWTHRRGERRSRRDGLWHAGSPAGQLASLSGQLSEDRAEGGREEKKKEVGYVRREKAEGEI